MYSNNRIVKCDNAGGNWTTYNYHFDDAISSMETLFVVASFDNWPDIMY